MEHYETQAETNPYEAMLSRFRVAAEKLKLDEGIYQILVTPDREITIAIPIQMDNGKLECLRVIGCNTVLPEGRPREVSGMLPMLPWMKSEPWRHG